MIITTEDAVRFVSTHKVHSNANVKLVSHLVTTENLVKVSMISSSNKQNRRKDEGTDDFQLSQLFFVIEIISSSR